MAYGDMPPLITDRETNRAFQKTTAERTRASPSEGVVRNPGADARLCGGRPGGEDGGRLGGIEGYAGREQRLQLMAKEWSIPEISVPGNAL
ncbi:unnamed protein product [Sphagnum balticum]